MLGRTVTAVCAAIAAIASLAYATSTVTWTEVPQWAPPLVGAWPCAGDLDGDGDRDLLCSEEYLHAFENVGGPSAPAWVDRGDWLGGIETCLRMTMALGDFDADGDQDLVAGCFYGEMVFFENTGDTFPLWDRNDDYFYVAPGGYVMKSPGIADLDGDGDLDIVVGVSYGSLLCFWNDGTPQEPSWRLDSSAFGGIQPSGRWVDPNFADLDGDGDLDLVTAPDSDSGVLQAYENAGSSTAPEWELNPGLLSGVAIPTHCFGASLSDLNSDGRPDLMLCELHVVRCYRNEGIPTAVDGGRTWSSIKALYK